MIPRDPKKAALDILGPPPAEEGGGEVDELEMAAQGILDAVQAGDAKGLAAAFRDCFAVAESEPHTEGEHE